MSFTANANGPRGFDPVQADAGVAPRLFEARVASAYAASLYTGQPVHIHTTGYVQVLADDNEDIAGVFAGCEYVAADGSIVFSPYWPASTAIKSGSVIKAKLYDAASRFLINSDEALDVSDIGDFFALTTTVGTGGSTLTGRSSAQLDGDTGNASAAGLLVQVVDISPREEGGDYAGTLAIVKFVRPLFGGKIDGAA